MRASRRLWYHLATKDKAGQDRIASDRTDAETGVGAGEGGLGGEEEGHYTSKDCRRIMIDLVAAAAVLLLACLCCLCVCLPSYRPDRQLAYPNTDSLRQEAVQQQRRAADCIQESSLEKSFHSPSLSVRPSVRKSFGTFCIPPSLSPSMSSRLVHRMTTTDHRMLLRDSSIQVVRSFVCGPPLSSTFGFRILSNKASARTLFLSERGREGGREGVGSRAWRQLFDP